ASRARNASATSTGCEQIAAPLPSPPSKPSVNQPPSGTMPFARDGCWRQTEAVPPVRNRESARTDLRLARNGLECRIRRRRRPGAEILEQGPKARIAPQQQPTDTFDKLQLLRCQRPRGRDRFDLVPQPTLLLGDCRQLVEIDEDTIDPHTRERS